MKQVGTKGTCAPLENPVTFLIYYKYFLLFVVMQVLTKGGLLLKIIYILTMLIVVWLVL